ncbi:MAG: hypothetical protein ACEQSR_09550, partial [Candidatus Methylacidiphilales bacterium]
KGKRKILCIECCENDTGEEVKSLSDDVMCRQVKIRDKSEMKKIVKFENYIQTDESCCALSNYVGPTDSIDFGTMDTYIILKIPQLAMILVLQSVIAIILTSIVEYKLLRN